MSLSNTLLFLLAATVGAVLFAWITHREKMKLSRSPVMSPMEMDALRRCMTGTNNVFIGRDTFVPQFLEPLWVVYGTIGLPSYSLWLIPESDAYWQS